MGHWENSGKSDEWYTPKSVFDALGVEFDLDVAAPAQAKTFVPAIASYSSDSLNKTWHGFIWMNPPFGGRNALEPWLERFFDHGHGIALVPDRTSAPWFRKAWQRADLALFTPKLRFHRPDGSVGKSPSTGTALFDAGKRAEYALLRAAEAGLGIVARPIGISIADVVNDRILVAGERLRSMLHPSGGRFSEISVEESVSIAKSLDRHIASGEKLRPSVAL